jgi:hypothetical protein
MTITNTILRNDYVANGSSTVFSFTFIVLSETAGYTIQVITTDLIGVETLKTQEVDYTVELNDNGLGTITFATAPLLNYKITLLSNVPNTQETDYIKAGTDKFPAESHEKALDKLTLIAKQFLEKFNRIVSLPKSSTLSNIEFPINASNANQVLLINSNGTNLATANLADVGIAPVSAYAKTLLDDVNSSEARATLDTQQLNANLTALAGLTGAPNKIPMFSGAGAMVLTDKIILATSTTTTQGISFSPNPITIANNATDANNDIDFTAGNAPLDDGSNQVLLSSTLVKKLDASWVAGTNQGGLFSGQKANSTRYYLFAITNGTINDAGFDISPTGANIPAGYKGSYRGMVLTNSGGDILAFEQLKNNYFEFITSILEGSGTTPLTRTPLPVSAPKNVIVKINAILTSVAMAGANHLYLTDLNKTDTTSVIKLFANNNFYTSGEFTVKTNSSSQIGIRGNGSSGSYEIFTLGFFDINIKN